LAAEVESWWREVTRAEMTWGGREGGREGKREGGRGEMMPE
jgi:hypothetical protein